MFEKSGQSQVDIVRQILLAGEVLTQEQAYKKYGIMRLASRINDLKNKGLGVCSHRKETRNRYGEKRKIAEYSIQNGGKAND
jgi:hypothetical protein